MFSTVPAAVGYTRGIMPSRDGSPPSSAARRRTSAIGTLMASGSKPLPDGRAA